MTLGSLIVRIGADLKGLDQGLQDATKRIQDAGRGFADVGKKLSTRVTLPLLALGAGAVKASLDFQQAMTGVAKTTAGTDAEVTAFVAHLGPQLQKLSEQMPTTAVELAGVAEAAGQLGVQRDAILGFTKVMADLGVSTNLSADEAATALARFANITQTSQSDFDRLGSTIVALGNSGASTEREIVDMGLRIAGAGAQVGLSADQILGFANALSSVGLEADAGGSAISRVFAELANASASGGESLQSFADVAGVSAQEFAQRFRTDAAGATIAFIQGLQRIKTEGGNVFGVLEDLHLSDIRVSRALLTAAGAGDLLSQSLKDGSAAWRENSALTEEASRFYATNKNQLIAAKNAVVNAAVAFGDLLAPSIVKVAQKIADFSRFLAGLNPAAQQLILVLAGVAAALGPVALGISAVLKVASAVKGVFAAVKFASLALGGPGALAILAFIAAAAGVAAIVDNWKIIVFEAKRTYEGIKTWLLDKFADVVDGIKRKVEAVTGFFRDMWHKVVGGSYVPDMVDGIASQFARLNGTMVEPAAVATQRVAEAFHGLTATVPIMQRVVDKSAELKDRLVDLRVDLAFATQASEAAKLRTEIKEVETQIGLADQAIKAFGKNLLLLKDIHIDIGIHDSTGRAPNDDGTVSGVSIVQASNDYLDSLVKLNDTTDIAIEHMSGFQSALFSLARFARDAGNVLLNAGKSVLDFAGGMIGKFIGLFNPLTIVGTALDEAIRQASASMNGKFQESITKIVTILVQALGPVLDALVPVFEALVPIIRDLAPLLQAVAEIAAALFKGFAPILKALVPLLRALFPVFKLLAIIATYVGQIFARMAQIILTVAGGLAIGIGTVIHAIGAAIDKIPFLGDFGLKGVGDSIKNAGKEMLNSADEFGEAFHTLADARREIKTITLDDPADAAADGMNAVADAGDNAARALNSIPGAGGGAVTPSVVQSASQDHPTTTVNGGDVVYNITVEAPIKAGPGDSDIDVYRKWRRGYTVAVRGATADDRAAAEAFPVV